MSTCYSYAVITPQVANSDMATPSSHTDEEPSPTAPADAFSALGHEIRVAILRTLWERYDPTANPDGVQPNEVKPLPFSELLARIDVDDRGQLNYHLNQLTDRFIRRTDAGYELTATGHKLVGAIIAGSTIEHARLPPVEIDVECPLCGAPIEVRYEYGTVIGCCTRCPGPAPRSERPPGFFYSMSFPPNGLRNRTPKEIFLASVRLGWATGVTAALQGICPSCAGPTRKRINACTDHAPQDDGLCETCNRVGLAKLLVVCETCKTAFSGHLGNMLLTYPTVVAFYVEHDINHHPGSWDAFARKFQYDPELVSEDPLRVRLTIPANDDELAVTFDGDANIVKLSS